jgi:hypothetical protein
VIENPAVTADVLFLRSLHALHTNEPDSLLRILPEDRRLTLRDIQVNYATFMHSLNEYYNYTALNYCNNLQIVLPEDTFFL